VKVADKVQEIEVEKDSERNLYPETKKEDRLKEAAVVLEALPEAHTTIVDKVLQAPETTNKGVTSHQVVVVCIAKDHIGLITVRSYFKTKAKL
jgi:hypothetical protein